jgi:hypothetical protein
MMAVFVGIIVACNLDRYLLSLKIGMSRTVENWKYGDDAEYLILSLLVLLGNDDQMKAVEFPSLQLIGRGDRDLRGLPDVGVVIPRRGDVPVVLDCSTTSPPIGSLQEESDWRRQRWCDTAIHTV